MIGAAISTLNEFAQVSGLAIQPQKSKVIYLNTSVTDETLGPFAVLQLGETAEYLGIETGLGDMDVSNWTTRLAKLRKRMGIASRTTVGVSDRVTILNSICLPGILFTANHYKPTTPATLQID